MSPAETKAANLEEKKYNLKKQHKKELWDISQSRSLVLPASSSMHKKTTARAPTPTAELAARRWRQLGVAVASSQVHTVTDRLCEAFTPWRSNTSSSNSYSPEGTVGSFTRWTEYPVHEKTHVHAITGSRFAGGGGRARAESHLAWRRASTRPSPSPSAGR